MAAATAVLGGAAYIGVALPDNVLPVRGTIYQVIANSTGGNKAVTGVFGSVLFDADGALGPGAPVVNGSTDKTCR